MQNFLYVNFVSVFGHIRLFSITGFVCVFVSVFRYMTVFIHLG